jgi:hypothetical protein
MGVWPVAVFYPKPYAALPNVSEVITIFESEAICIYSSALRKTSPANLTRHHGRMARGGHGLPKVSPRPDKPYPSTLYGRATLETASNPEGGGLRPSSTPLDTPLRTPMPFTKESE